MVCAYFEHMWGVGEKTEAFALMSEYVAKIHATSTTALNALKAQGYLTLGVHPSTPLTFGPFFVGLRNWKMLSMEVKLDPPHNPGC